jgi:hypothetical protein
LYNEPTNSQLINNLLYCSLLHYGPGSSVCIATGYGLDGPGIESRWGGQDFPHLSRPALGPNQLPVQWVYRVFPGGKERPGRDADPSPPSSAVGHERVELYLYSPYGSYGQYRASVPVQGWPLPFFILHCPYIYRRYCVICSDLLVSTC